MLTERHPVLRNPLPNIDTLRQLEHTASLTALACIARSGTMLIQTYLDGHPEILQLPTTLQYFDFAARTPSLLSCTAREAAEAFANDPEHMRYFRSEESVLHKGRLGPGMDVAVEIDRAAFVEAVTNVLPLHNFSHREFLTAVILGFGWCLGQRPERAKVLFWHLHHGDWLFPSHEPEQSNLWPLPKWEGINLVRPDRMIFSIRNPVETIESIAGFVDKLNLTPEQKERQFNTYLKLYSQDLARYARIRATGIPCSVVRLEDIRQRTAHTLAELARWLGIQESDSCLETPTAFGHLWFGDIYMSPTNAPKAQPPIRRLTVFEPEEALVLLAGSNVLPQCDYDDQSFLRSAGAMASLQFRPARLRWCHSVEIQKELSRDRRKFYRNLLRNAVPAKIGG